MQKNVITILVMKVHKACKSWKFNDKTFEMLEDFICVTEKAGGISSCRTDSLLHRKKHALYTKLK